MLRGSEEVRLDFERAERLLDAGLEALKKVLPMPPFQMWEHSNRGGWDMSGFPYYVWYFLIFRDQQRDSRIHRSAVELDYLEPLGTDEPRVLKVRSVAEIFQIGSRSDVSEVDERIVAITDLGGPDGFTAMVREALRVAEERLAQLGRGTPGPAS